MPLTGKRILTIGIGNSGADITVERLSHEFHRGVNIAAESPKLAQLMSQVNRYALKSEFPTVEGWAEQQSMHDHRRVLTALRERDG